MTLATQFLWTKHYHQAGSDHVWTKMAAILPFAEELLQ